MSVPEITAEEQGAIARAAVGEVIDCEAGLFRVLSHQRGPSSAQGWKTIFTNLPVSQSWAFYWHEGDTFDPEEHTSIFEVRSVRVVARQSNGYAYVAEGYYERV